MTFQVPIHIDDTAPTASIKDTQITIDEDIESVSSQAPCVSKSHIRIIIQKLAQILATQGLSCCECSQTHYKLYSLSDCKDIKSKYFLEVQCPDNETTYQFELTFTQINSDTEQTENTKGRF